MKQCMVEVNTNITTKATTVLNFISHYGVQDSTSHDLGTDFNN